MRLGLRIFLRSLVTTYENLGMLMVANLLWFVFSVPVLIALSVLAFGSGFYSEEAGPGQTALRIGMILLVVLPNPVSGAIYLMATRLVADEVTHFDIFWVGLRAYFWRGLALFAANLVLLVLAVGAARFYLEQESAVFKVIGIFFLYVLVVWLGTQQFIVPLLVRLQDKSLTRILRTALLICLRHWPFTVALVIINAIVIAISVLLVMPVLILLLSFLAVVQSWALAEVVLREPALARRLD